MTSDVYLKITEKKKKKTFITVELVFLGITVIIRGWMSNQTCQYQTIQFGFRQSLEIMFGFGNVGQTSG